MTRNYCMYIRAVKKKLRTKCNDEVSLHFNAFLTCTFTILPEKENINGEMLFTSTESKLFSQNAYLLHFLEGNI